MWFHCSLTLSAFCFLFFPLRTRFLSEENGLCTLYTCIAAFHWIWMEKSSYFFWLNQFIQCRAHKSFDRWSKEQNEFLFENFYSHFFHIFSMDFAPLAVRLVFDDTEFCRWHKNMYFLFVMTELINNNQCAGKWTNNRWAECSWTRMQMFIELQQLDSLYTTTNELKLWHSIQQWKIVLQYLKFNDRS